MSTFFRLRQDFFTKLIVASHKSFENFWVSSFVNADFNNPQDCMNFCMDF